VLITQKHGQSDELDTSCFGCVHVSVVELGHQFSGNVEHVRQSTSELLFFEDSQRIWELDLKGVESLKKKNLYKEKPAMIQKIMQYNY
jgi:hypothetical protein